MMWEGSLNSTDCRFASLSTVIDGFSPIPKQSFFRDWADELNYRIIEEVPVGAVGHSLAGRFARLAVKHVLGKDQAKDLFNSTYWCVIEKNVPDFMGSAGKDISDARQV